MTTVAAGPMGFVAAGFDHSGGRGVPAVWWSPDGSAWTRSATGPGSPFVAGQIITGVAVNDRGAVAVGTLETSGDVDAMAWFSPDGTTWRTVPLGLAGFTGPKEQEALAVTATADGFIAGGGDADAERRRAVVWRSADGILWQRQPPTAEMSQTVSDSTAGLSIRAMSGSGPMVAVGGSLSLRIWTSGDGRRWTLEQLPVRASGEGAVVAADAGAAILRPGSGGLWFRTPGGAWSDVGGDHAVFPGPARTSSVVSMVRAGDTFVALGYDGDSPARWTSSGGRRWMGGKPFEAGSVAEVTAFGNDLVAVGTTRPVANEGNVAATWISTDNGVTWAAVGAGNPAFRIEETTQMLGVTASGVSLVAVGLSYDGSAIDAHAWVSTDGRSWRRAVDPPAWTGPGDQIVSIVCPLPGGGVVALGTVTISGETDTWAWISPDGVTWDRARAPGASVLGGAGGQFPYACASTATAVLVVGMVTGDGGTDGVLWSSPDGSTWSVSGADAPFAGPMHEGLRGIAVDGARIVLTGREGDDLTVFTSSDGGATWTKRTAESFGGPGYQTAYPVIAGDEAVLYGRNGPGAAVWIGPAP